MVKSVPCRRENLVLINWVNAETYLFCSRQHVMLQDTDTWTAPINHIILLTNVAVLYQLWHSDGQDEIRLPWCIHNLHAEADDFCTASCFVMCNTSDVALSARLLTFRRTIPDCFYFICGNLIFDIWYFIGLLSVRRNTKQTENSFIRIPLWWAVWRFLPKHSSIVFLKEASVEARCCNYKKRCMNIVNGID